MSSCSCALLRLGRNPTGKFGIRNAIYAGARRDIYLQPRIKRPAMTGLKCTAPDWQGIIRSEFAEEEIPTTTRRRMPSAPTTPYQDQQALPKPRLYL